MKTHRLATVLATAAVLLLIQTAGSGQTPKAAAVTADALAWQELSVKGSGVMIATVSGDYTQDAWAGFVRFPAGSKSGVHTHSNDLKIVVVTGTFHYGSTPDTERNYGPGSYIFIPGNLPHSNSQPQGALLYTEQPGKFDNKPAK
jgi:uncharacterized RmlC-like cupin family protein